MDLCSPVHVLHRFGVLLVLELGLILGASYSKLAGRAAMDSSDRSVPGAELRVRNAATLIDGTATTNYGGICEVPALPAATYRVQLRIGVKLLF